MKELADHTGKPRRLEDFRGKAVVLFFGFTHIKQLGPDADRVQMLMVSVDPERDTQDVLREKEAGRQFAESVGKS